MAETQFLAAARHGLELIGYTGPLLRENYAFSDVLKPDDELRHVDLAAFGQEPPSYRTASIGVIVDEAGSALHLRDYRALGAPQILTLKSDRVRRWKIRPHDEPELLEEFSPELLLPAIVSHQDEWGPLSVLRARAISFRTPPPQLDFFDIGLLPAIESVVQEKLHRLLSDTIAVVRATYTEHYNAAPDFARLCRLVFRLLAGKLLADRGHEGGWHSADPGQVISAVEAFYFEASRAPAVLEDPRVQDVAWRQLRSGPHLQNISVGALAHIHENTLVDAQIRRRQSIHSTPPELAEYVVRRLPFEALPVDERRVFEPFAGHAVFLVAALGRLRDLLGPGPSNRHRHDYFVRMLSGLENEPFAIEVARLSLMLADYPHPDGWNLHAGDVFTSPRLRSELRRAKIVLCNPPYESFSADERSRYTGLVTPNKAVATLTRVLTDPPAMLGFVLPRVVLDGRSYRTTRELLTELYGHIETVALPDRTFTHSEAEPVLLLAHGREERPNRLRTALVRRTDLPVFYRTGRPTLEAEEELGTFMIQNESSFWIDPLKHVWAALSELPQFGDLAEIHRGIEYKLRLREHRTELVSQTRRPGFVPGLVSVTDDFEPYTVRNHVYLRLASDLMRTRAHELPWDRPKVIANAARVSRGPWRLIAAPDHSGLVCTQRFHGIWPRSEMPLEVLAAIINGPVANAFVGAREPGRDNQIGLLEAIPVPELEDASKAEIVELVSEYVRSRDALHETSEPSDISALSELLTEIDDLVLAAYRLPLDVEADLRRYFAGHLHPGPQPAGESPTARRRIRAPLPLPLFDRATDNLDSATIERLYSFRNREGVLGFLEQFPFLVPLLAAAHRPIRGFFPTADLGLDIVTDPEVAGDVRLQLRVRSELSPSDALSAMDRFDEEWWLDRLPEAKDKLTVALAF